MKILMKLFQMEDIEWETKSVRKNFFKINLEQLNFTEQINCCFLILNSGDENFILSTFPYLNEDMKEIMKDLIYSDINCYRNVYTEKDCSNPDRHYDLVCTCFREELVGDLREDLMKKLNIYEEEGTKGNPVFRVIGSK